MVGYRVHYQCSFCPHATWKEMHSIAPIQVYPWSSISWSARCHFTAYTSLGWIRASSAVSLRFSVISSSEEEVATWEIRFVVGSCCRFRLAIFTEVPDSYSWRASIRNHLTTRFLYFRGHPQLRNGASAPDWNSLIRESTCLIWLIYIYCFGATYRHHGPHPDQ